MKMAYGPAVLAQQDATILWLLPDGDLDRKGAALIGAQRGGCNFAMEGTG